MVNFAKTNARPNALDKGQLDIAGGMNNVCSISVMSHEVMRIDFLRWRLLIIGCSTDVMLKYFHARRDHELVEEALCVRGKQRSQRVRKFTPSSVVSNRCHLFFDYRATPFFFSAESLHL